MVAGVLGLIAVLAVMTSLAPDAERNSVKPEARPADPKLQAQRSAFLDQLRADGLITVLECRKLGGTLGVTPRFMAIDFEQKESVVGVAYAYCFDGKPESGIVRLVDSRTRNKVGTFSPGLLDLE
jgi:hypothetical protein